MSALFQTSAPDHGPYARLAAEMDRDPVHRESALARCLREIERSGRRSNILADKNKARVFQRHPMHLDVVREGLSEMEPAEALAALDAIVAFERGVTLAGAPHGRGTIRSNLRAAQIALRMRRRHERRVLADMEAC